MTVYYWDGVAQCIHDYNEPVFVLGGVSYYGASQREVFGSGANLVINLTSEPNIPHNKIHDIPKLAQHIIKPFDELMIPWPDMGVIMAGPEIWRDLAEYIENEGYGHVCFQCHAGHGRTGTALASMLIANEGCDAIEAVNWVREWHCSSAVESFKQAEYLKELDTFYNSRTYSMDQNEAPLPSVVSFK